VDLATLEGELLRLAQAEKRRWQQIAEFLMRVDRERLWVGQAASFTAWIQGMARRADLQESVFWRSLKAGRIYLELTGRDALDADAALSPESLELANKIQRCAPMPIASQVIASTLNGELSRAELRNVWTTYKPAAGGNNARGRLPDDPDERAEAIEARKAAWEAQKRKPEHRADVCRAELMAGFRNARWLEHIDQARAESATSSLPGKFAAVLTVRRDAKQSEALALHGLWTCVSAPELADYEFAAPGSTDFVWFAVPSELAERAQHKAPRMVGILALTPARDLRIVREAQRRPLNARDRLELLNALLQRAYLWP
jgi:hypothetical protein